jgi:hypothetical protein
LHADLCGLKVANTTSLLKSNDGDNLGCRPSADYLKPELTAETQPKPDFGDFLDRVRRGQAAVGKERAVPIVLGE